MKKHLIIIVTLLFISYNGITQCQILDYDGIVELRDSLTDHFPDICKQVIIGSSVWENDIVALKFSDNVNIDEAEPEILLTWCIHGDEQNPEQVAMKLSRQLCLNYNNDPQITDLINNREIWIIPMLNPDGFIGDFGFRTRTNANHVDLNRNSGYMWNPEFGFQYNPSPYSEPESKAIRDFILARNFNIMVDYHSGLQGIIYPWYYKTDQCPDYTEILHLANKYDTESGYPDGEFAVTAGSDLYLTNGSLVEFAYGALGIYAYSVELMDFNNTQWNDCELLNINLPSILMMIQNAGEGITGLITDVNSGAPIPAKIEIQGRVPSYTGTAHGDYHRFLLPGNYTISVSANGYQTQTSDVVVTSGSAIIKDFQLLPEEQYSAQKIITCRNLNNYNDPATTWNALGMNDGLKYAIGDTGYVVLDMGAAIVPISGNDVTVHGNASGANNAFELFYSNSIDGPWNSLGTGNSTTSFDIGNVTNARYFKLEDNGNGPGNVEGAGFNLDAITASDINAGVNQVIAEYDISVYPNPTTGVIYITQSNMVDYKELRVYNINGSLILQNKEVNSIDLSNLSPGTYFLQIFTESAIVTHKIIKQ